MFLSPIAEMNIGTLYVPAWALRRPIAGPNNSGEMGKLLLMGDHRCRSVIKLGLESQDGKEGDGREESRC